MKSSFITKRLSTWAAASIWVLLGRDQTLEQGKGGMCLSSPYMGWRHCWDSGGICGGKSIPRHCSLCSHFNCSYSPKALKWGASSTTPCLSVRAKPDQAKANHLTLTLPPTPDAHALSTSCSPMGVCRTKLLGLRNRPGLRWCYRPSVCPSGKTRKGKGTWFQNIMDLVTMPQRGA